jgi:hypothetical protein
MVLAKEGLWDVTLMGEIVMCVGNAYQKLVKK